MDKNLIFQNILIKIFLQKLLKNHYNTLKINYIIYVPKIEFIFFKFSLPYLENKSLNILKLIIIKNYE